MDRVWRNDSRSFGGGDVAPDQHHAVRGDVRGEFISNNVARRERGRGHNEKMDVADGTEAALTHVKEEIGTLVYAYELNQGMTQMVAWVERNTPDSLKNPAPLEGMCTRHQSLLTMHAMIYYFRAYFTPILPTGVIESAQDWMDCVAYYNSKISHQIDKIRLEKNPALMQRSLLMHQNPAGYTEEQQKLIFTMMYELDSAAYLQRTEEVLDDFSTLVGGELTPELRGGASVEADFIWNLYVQRKRMLFELLPDKGTRRENNKVRDPETIWPKLEAVMSLCIYHFLLLKDGLVKRTSSTAKERFAVYTSDEFLLRMVEERQEFVKRFKVPEGEAQEIAAKLMEAESDMVDGYKAHMDRQVETNYGVVEESEEDLRIKADMDEEMERLARELADTVLEMHYPAQKARLDAMRKAKREAEETDARVEKEREALKKEMEELKNTVKRVEGDETRKRERGGGGGDDDEQQESGYVHV